MSLKDTCIITASFHPCSGRAAVGNCPHRKDSPLNSQPGLVIPSLSIEGFFFSCQVEVLENGSGKISDLRLLHEALETTEMLVHKKWQGMSNGNQDNQIITSRFRMLFDSLKTGEMERGFKKPQTSQKSYDKCLSMNDCTYLYSFSLLF